MPNRYRKLDRELRITHLGQIYWRLWRSQRAITRTSINHILDRLQTGYTSNRKARRAGKAVREMQDSGGNNLPAVRASLCNIVFSATLRMYRRVPLANDRIHVLNPDRLDFSLCILYLQCNRTATSAGRIHCATKTSHVLATSA